MRLGRQCPVPWASVDTYLCRPLYRVRYRTPDRGQTDKRGFKTKRDAEAFANTVEVTKARGEYVAPSLGRVMVGELGPAWLERKRGHMKPSAFRSYENALARLRGAALARRRRLARFATPGCKLGSPKLSSKGFSAFAVITVYSVLAGILDDAVRDRMLAANPARGVSLPPQNQAAERLPDGRATSSIGRRVRALRIADPIARGPRDCAGARRPRCACATWISCGAASSCMRTRSRSVAAPIVGHAQDRTSSVGGVTGVRRRRAGGDVRGQGPRRTDLARA